jgi:hypothetical protein
MRLLRVVPLLVLTLLAPTPSVAQTVRGMVEEEDTGRAISGALVVLVSGGQTVAGGLTSEQGHFSLAAPAPGRYIVRVERIGLRTVATEVEVQAGGTAELRIAMVDQAFVLPPLQVTTEERCTVRPGQGLRAYELWRQAAVALHAAAVAEERGLLEYTVRTYRRNLVNGRYRNREDRPQRVRGTPFNTLPPAELARRGYRREARDTVTHYGPDARALLSNEFLDGHCLYVRTEAEIPGEVGLAFEPVEQRRVVDVRGTLWMDARSGELRSMDFEYEGGGRDAPGARSGGRIYFGRHATGAWYVSRWFIRTVQRRRPGAPSLGKPLAALPEIIREAGGEVTDVVVVQAPP